MLVRGFLPLQLFSRPLSRRTSVVAAAAAMLRVSIIDSDGNPIQKLCVTSKMDLIDVYKLIPRDLRKVDADTSANPAILVRPQAGAILANLGVKFKGIIKHDQLILLDSLNEPNPLIERSDFISELQSILKLRSNLPFEFRVLETALLQALTEIDADLDIFEPEFEAHLEELRVEISRDKLTQLLKYSERLSKLDMATGNIRGAIAEVLNSDEDLAAMFLSERVSGRVRAKEDHGEAELLLGALILCPLFFRTWYLRE